MKKRSTDIIAIILILFMQFSVGLVCAEDGKIDASDKYGFNSVQPMHVTSIHAEPNKTILAPCESYTISVNYNVSHDDDYYFKAWYHNDGAWDEIYSQDRDHTSEGRFSLTIGAHAPDKMGNHTVRVAGTQDYWSTPYDYNVAHDFEINVTIPFPDLAISSSDIDVLHRDGEIDIIVTIHNNGVEDVNNVFIQFYAQDFLTGAVTHISHSRIESIPHGHVVTSSATWEPTLQYYKIYVCADPEDEIKETNENNNIAYKSIGGPTINDVKSKYRGFFLSGISIDNTYYVFTSEEDVDYVEFKMNENVKTDSDGSDGWSMMYDMGDLPIFSKLTMTAFNDAGIPSDPFIIMPQITECPEWFKTINSMGNPIIDISAPQKYDNLWQIWYSIEVPDPKLEAIKNLPVPVIGGDFGMAVSSKFGYEIRSDDILKLSGGGEADVKIADHGGAIEVLLEGLLKRVPPKLKLDGAEIKIDGKIMVPIPSLKWNILKIINVKVQIVPELKVAFGILEDPSGGIIDGLGWKSTKGTFYTALEGYGKIEEGIGHTEAKVGGKPGLKFKVPPPYYDGVVAQIYAKLKQVVFGWSQEFEIEYEWCDPPCSSSSSGLRLVTSNQESAEWKPIPRDYATKDYAKSSGSKANLKMPDVQTLALNALGAQEASIIENIFPYVSPSIATDNSGNAIMVWTHDDINKPQMQGFEVYYSTWDGNSWNSTSAVTDNYLPEFEPRVLFDSNGNAIAVWTLFNNASITANSSVFSVLNDVELTYSVWDKNSKTWSTPKILTDNSMFEGLVSLSTDINGNVAATWIVDKDNNITTISDRDICYSIWNGSDWSELKVVTTDVAVDVNPTLVYSQNNAISVWSQDTDGNITSKTDIELYYAVWNGNQWSTPTYLTNDSIEDTVPTIVFDKFNKIILTWIKRNETADRIYISTYDNGWSNPELVVESLTIYEMGLSFDSDNNAAIVWQGASTSGQDIFYTVRDNSNQLWSGEKQLTEDISAEWQLSTTINPNNEIMISYLKQNISIINYTVVEGESDLCYLIHPIMLDLTLDSTDIIFSNETAYPGDTITINATIHNIGDIEANSVEVKFFDGSSGPQIGITQTIPSLPAGQNATVSARWDIPALQQSHDIYIKVDPDDKIPEINESNNVAFASIALPDLEIDGSDATFSYEHGSLRINATIHNLGVITTSNVPVEFFDEGSNGISIDATVLDSLSPNSNETISMLWNTQGVSSGIHNISVVIDQMNDIQEQNETNNIANLTLMILSDLTVNANNVSFSEIYEGNLTISANIRNIGISKAENITIGFYDGDPSANGTLIGSAIIDSISAENEAIAEIIWYATPGQNDIYIQIDPSNLIQELDKSNNIALNHVITTSPVDLIIDSPDITFSDNNPTRGGFVKINATVRNNGNSDALGINVQFFSGNPDTDGTLIGVRTITLIPSDSNRTVCMEPISIGEYNLRWILTTGLHDIYVKVDPCNNISETDESNNIAFNTINVIENSPPSFSDVSLSPNAGSWKDEFTYSINLSDIEGDDVSITLQTFTNGNWIGAETILVKNTTLQKTVTLKHRFTSVDRSQTAKCRLYYHDEVNKNDYHSGELNTGYYPDTNGLSGPELDNTSHGLGIIEGGGTGQGSSFYSWDADIYTIVQPHDETFVTASGSINRVEIYDHSDDIWHYYNLNTTYARGDIVNITEASNNHLNHFIRINVYNNDTARDFHLIKETLNGGTVEGGDPGSGGSFTKWSTSAYTILLPGDRVYVAADKPVNKLGIFDYVDNEWDYYDLVNIVPKSTSIFMTVLPKGEAINITSYLQPYQNRFVHVKVLQDNIERNFHIIKTTDRGGIVEGGQSDQGGSSFYSWSPSLYTIIQPDDHVYMTADDSYNFIKIIDKTTGEIYREYISNHNNAEVVDIVSYLQDLPNYINHLIEIQVYDFEVQRNLHLVKITPDGGIVEGGYASSHSSFGSWSSSIYTLFRTGDRILIAATDEFDTIKIINYTDDKMHTINLGNVYPNHTLVDVTTHLCDYEGHFIELRVYDQISEKDFHIIKVHEKKDTVLIAAPTLSDADVSPDSGSWKDEYIYRVNVSDADSGAVNVTLQLFTNDRWINVETKSSSGTGTLEWTHQFTSLDRTQSAKYRFYYDDGHNTGYYPDISGLPDPILDDTGYGLGMIEGAGTGKGSSFYSWDDDLYTIIQPGDCMYTVADDTINKVAIYDYSDDKWYYFPLNNIFVRGELVNISGAGFDNHLNHFVRIKVYFNDDARNFHLIKQTPDGGTVDGGFSGSGGSFTTWSAYANTIIREDDRIYVAADAPVNKIKILNYTDDQWHESEIVGIVPGHGIHLSSTVSPKAEVIEVTSYLQPFVGRFVQIKILQDSTERNFHIIKKTKDGGIVEGAEGDTYGSSFYSWYSSLYTAVQKGDCVCVASDGQFNRLRILDKTKEEWKYVNLSSSYQRGEVADVSKCFIDYTNNMLQIEVYNDTTQQNFHLVKINQDGGIVEGGYPDTDSSFNSWATDTHILLRPEDQIIIAPNGYIDTIKVYDYVDDQWHVINLGGNVYARYTLVDITPYMSAFKGHFIQLQVYHVQTQESYHIIKAFEGRKLDNSAPVLSDADVSPDSGSWKDKYIYRVNVSDVDSDVVNVTLQVFTDDRWINIETRNTLADAQLSYKYQFTCTDRNQIARYRFYYDDSTNASYYPSLHGASGPVLDDTSYGMGIVEGGGSGYGSSFYTWYTSLYTVVMPGDTVHVVASEPINNLQVYDYTTKQWYTYDLHGLLENGRGINITWIFADHLNNFIQLKVYYGSLAKSFHMVKQTPSGGMVEGGYPGYGSSFASWSTYVNTIIRKSDRVYVAPEYDVNKIGVYNYSNDQWVYHTLETTKPASRLLDISPYVLNYTNRFIKIKVLTDSTERNFHIIKQNSDGGIVEGADGGTYGSSFYSWYSSLYTTVLDGDHVFIAADDTVNKIRIHDYTTDIWQYHDLNRTYLRGEVVDVSDFFANYTNHFVQIKLHQNETARNFHLLKTTPSGGMVEGGYQNSHSSFNSWATDMYTLLGVGDRLLVTPTDNIDMVRVYDYTSDEWHTVNLGGNVFEKYSLVDITPFIEEFEGKFIRLQVYYQESQKNYHLIKVK